MTHKGKPYIRRDWLARKKSIYDRHTAGETYAEIGASLGVAAATAAQQGGEWAYILENIDTVFGRTDRIEKQIAKELLASPACISEKHEDNMDARITDEKMIMDFFGVKPVQPSAGETIALLRLLVERVCRLENDVARLRQMVKEEAGDTGL